MNFQNLDYFVTAATERSFTKAAEKLYITQQTLSGQIISLEKETGCKLFLRTKPLALTPAGQIFYSYATGLLRDYRKMQGDLALLARKGDNTINIGVAYSGAIPRLMNFFEDFRRIVGPAQFQIMEMPGGDLIERLRDGTIDFAIAHFPEHDPAFVRYPFLEEEIVLLATDELLRATFDGATDAVIRELQNTGDYSLLKRCPYVRNTKNNIVARFADRFMAEHIPTPQVNAESDSFDSLLEICRQGAAFSLFPRQITAEILQDATLSCFHVFPLGESAKFTIHYGYLKDSPRRELIEKIIQSARMRKAKKQTPQ